MTVRRWMVKKMGIKAWWKRIPLGVKGAIIGLIIGILLDFTPVVYFTIIWRILLGDTIIAHLVSWITFPLVCLILGIFIEIRRGKLN